MTRIASGLLVALSLLAAVPSAPAQIMDDDATANAPLIRSLQELGYRYVVKSNGWIVVEVPAEDGSTTNLFILPPQRNALGDSYRLVVARLADFKGPAPENVTELVKQLNPNLPFGEMGIIKTNDGTSLVLFLTRMPANGSANELGSYLRDVAKVSLKVGAVIKKGDAIN
jgi:hypothetical protein